MKVEVAVLGIPVPNSPQSLCGRKATLEEEEDDDDHEEEEEDDDHEEEEEEDDDDDDEEEEEEEDEDEEEEGIKSRAQVLCESRGGRPGLSVPNSPRGFCGRTATLN